jgi:hypothetical protein
MDYAHQKEDIGGQPVPVKRRSDRSAAVEFDVKAIRTGVRLRIGWPAQEEVKAVWGYRCHLTCN